MDGGRSLDIVELVGIVNDACCDGGLWKAINVIFERWALLIYYINKPKKGE